MSDQTEQLQKQLRERIVVIDGAMGTTIRTYGLGETDIRGERFKDAKKDLKNNGDLYSLTKADVINTLPLEKLRIALGKKRKQSA